MTEPARSRGVRSYQEHGASGHGDRAGRRLNISPFPWKSDDSIHRLVSQIRHVRTPIFVTKQPNEPQQGGGQGKQAR